MIDGRGDPADGPEVRPRVCETGQIGKAGEHLVISDIYRAGYQAVTAGDDGPVDVIIIKDNGELIRVQVKTKQDPVWRDGRVEFGITRGGSGRQRSPSQPFRTYSDNDFDILACVDLKSSRIAYVRATPHLLLAASVCIRADEFAPFWKWNGDLEPIGRGNEPKPAETAQTEMPL